MAQKSPAQPATFDAAPLDRYVARITTRIAYVGGVLMLPLLFAYLSNLRWGGLFIPSTCGVMLALFLLLAYSVQPVAYQLDGRHLIVRCRWWRALRIPLSQISDVSFAPTLGEIPQRGLRFAFNPGIFGYQGPFYLAPYGEAFFLATNREYLVSVARRSLPPLIISPAQPRMFVAALQQYLEERDPATRGRDHTAEDGRR